MKERRFITPLALYAKRPLPPPPGNWDNTGRGCGRGKGRGKGKATTTARGSSRALDDKAICFRYNSKAGCKKKDKWRFVHLCQLCFARHPAYQCKAGVKDTQSEVSS